MRSTRATLRRGSEEVGGLKERIGVVVSWDNRYYLVRMEQQQKKEDTIAARNEW